MNGVDNKMLARRYIQEAWNRGNLGVIDELFAPDYANHNASLGQAPGVEGLTAMIASFREAFPDLHLTIDDLIAEGEKVVTRWTARGTHQGTLLGVPPSGKQVTVTTIAIDRFVAGKITDHWATRDELGLLVQLGLVKLQGSGAT
jgi:steroid delta-isomerase-like uncharacterized protein